MSVSFPYGWLTFNGISRMRRAPAFFGLTPGALRLPTDPVGNFTLTLTNVVPGSAIRIEQLDGTLREFRVAAGSEETFILAAYASGTPGNNLRIKVRKGTTAAKYLPYQTYTTAFKGSQSVYIAQVEDTVAM